MRAENHLRPDDSLLTNPQDSISVSAFPPQAAEAQQDNKVLQQRVENLQRDKQRLEGELEEAERQLKVTKARQVKHEASREEGKESKVTDGDLDEGGDHKDVVVKCYRGTGIWIKEGIIRMW